MSGERLNLPHGELTSLSYEEIQGLLGEIRTESAPSSRGLRWLLAHGRDGVTWGVVEDGRWALAHTWFPEITPEVDPVALLMLRAFGPDEELLVWRDGAALRGRRLADASQPPHDWDPFAIDTPARSWWSGNGAADAMHPVDERHLLIAGDSGRVDDRVLERGPFSLLADGTGARQAVPLLGLDAIDLDLFPPALHVRHHLTRDVDHGVVHITATRLVALAPTRSGRDRA